MYVADIFIFTAIYWLWKSRKAKSKFDISTLSKFFIGLGVIKIILVVVLNKSSFQFDYNTRIYLSEDEKVNYSSYHYSLTLFYPVWVSYYYFTAKNRMKNDKNFLDKQELEIYSSRCFNKDVDCTVYISNLLNLAEKSNKYEQKHYIQYFEENFLKNKKIKKLLNCNNYSSYISYLSLYSKIKLGKRDYYKNMLSSFNILEDELEMMSQSCTAKRVDLVKFEFVFKSEEDLINSFHKHCRLSEITGNCTNLIDGADFAENANRLVEMPRLEDEVKSFCKNNEENLSCKDFQNSLSRRQQGLNLLIVK